jgi:hypothetical protein
MLSRPGCRADGRVWTDVRNCPRPRWPKGYGRSLLDLRTITPSRAVPEPSVVKDVKTELSRYLDEGQKHLATMKKDLEGDKEAVADVEKLEKDLAKAIEHNKAMIACCEHEKFDKIATMSCCTDLVKQLDKVHADHVALMKKLTAKYAATPAKP